MKADIVIDLLYGDNAKGKCCKALMEENEYTHAIRFNGSSNAGHTIIHEGKTLITHSVPSGIILGAKSIIGPGCVLNPNKFLKEIKYLEDAGINCELVKVAYNTHIITEEHITEDDAVLNIGTTKSGNGGAYRDKSARTGIRAENIPELKPYFIDIYEELYSYDNPYILFEGAQGIGLDIDWGPLYPYLTSSSCMVGAALNNGVPYTAINKVYGVIKGYTTYVGTYKFQPQGDIYKTIQKVGKEFGATTGRPRQVDFLHLDFAIKAARMNGVNTLIVNKMDILQEVNTWKVHYNGELKDLQTEENFKEFIKKTVPVNEVIFSYSPEKI